MNGAAKQVFSSFLKKQQQQQQQQQQCNEISNPMVRSPCILDLVESGSRSLLFQEYFCLFSHYI
jgi:hypothetical protein